MGCFSIFAVLCLLSFTFAGAKHEATAANKNYAAIVVGTVYCDTCFQDAGTRFISGASVAVECRRGRFRQEVKTNEQGKFKVKLPFSVSKQVQSIRRCSVKLVSSSDPSCAVTSTANSTSSLHRINKQGDDLHVFSAGIFTFKPAQHENSLCSQKDLSALPTQPSPDMKQNHFMSLLPKLPPLPQLPPLPALPSLPRMPFFPPWSGKTKQAASGKPTFRKGPGNDDNNNNDDDDQLSNQKSRQQQRHQTTQPQGFLPMPPILPPIPFIPSPPLIPNPFQPPPSVLPPIFPTPPPSLFPPIFPTPPPAPWLPIPPIPSLFTPPPPPPPPPPFHFPPIPPLLPFPPGFPGGPPRSGSHKSGP